MEEREVCEREAAHPTSVEDLSLSHERETKDSTLEKHKVTEEKRSKEDIGTLKDTVSESDNNCDLKITEKVHQFVEVSSINYNEPEEIHKSYILKPETLHATESKPVPISTTMKNKLEPKSVGPLKDEDVAPWNGITLNRCLVVAAVAALLSVGFQVLQDAVDSDDDLGEIEAEPWTPLNPNEQSPEPWFFEGWFGSSEPQLSAVEEPKTPDIEEPELPVIEEPELPVIEEPEPPADEEPVLTSVEKEEVTEMQADLLIQEPLEPEKGKAKKDKQKPTEQWGLKAKGKYMEVKAAKIRRAPEGGSQIKEGFPFPKKLKESTKSYPEIKEKSYKEKSYQKKYDERKIDHSKKHEFGKFKQERGEQNKYFRQDKGRRADKENKEYKQYHQESDFKKKQDSKHHR
ncbi:junctional sarcoplasmic reticulum protein 1 [Mixophyes fleayi]|uniref:junctional sarcoplasmic reticulum protein 1 n=1 Tax=Mixophyes fleayi TaxID=3061075 RepID=UPI003F4E0389